MAGQDKSLNSAEAESVDLTHSSNQADAFLDYPDLCALDNDIITSTNSSRNDDEPYNSLGACLNGSLKQCSVANLSEATQRRR